MIKNENSPSSFSIKNQYQQTFQKGTTRLQNKETKEQKKRSNELEL